MKTLPDPFRGLAAVRCLALAALLSGDALRAEVPPLSDLISGDGPVLWHSFESELDAALTKGSVERVDGPDRRVSLTLPEKNRAIRLKGDGAHLRLDDSEALRFAQGDSITVEAWVRLDEVVPGASAYLIGKGRSAPGGRNQNWGLRLTESGGAAKLSFLFRSQPTEAKPEGDYHRWTSSAGISADGKWHHLALSYTFGKPDSLKGFIDGRERSGRWEAGGKTTEPPVVDDDVAMIGSSLGGSPANSLNGAIDEIAVYREALDAARVQARYQRVVPDPLPPQLAAVPAGKVLVEIREGVGERDLWPDLDGRPDELFPVDAFSLSSLPHAYNERAARRDRKLPLHVRLAAEVELPPGEHTLLFRAPGLSRLFVDGEERADQPYFNISGSAHGQPRPMPETDPGYPRLRMGTQETTLPLRGDGGRKLVVVEGMVGQPGRRLGINELLLAVRYEGEESWHLLAAGADRSAVFDAEGFHLFNQEQAAQFDRLDAERRQVAYGRIEGEVEKRHEAARAYLKTLDPVPLPAGIDADAAPSRVVDAFLATRRREARAAASAGGPEPTPEHVEAIRLLEANCFRCHGEKSSGGLKLNSRDAALAEGKSGLPAVVPGDPEESELLYRLLTDDPDELMPPEGERFDEKQSDLVRRWIADGAPWAASAAALEELPGTLDELSLLRRLYLHTVGVLPSPEEIRDHQARPAETRVSETIDRLLEDPRHADHWVSYWQDALAENPRLIKPVLNNTGPFRYWLHEALLDNRPMDQFAADLLTFQGSVHGGGAGGFVRAAENDVPMAAKAHVVGNAFLGVEMKCALCHDAPYHSIKQEDVFSLAAMLGEKPIVLPETASVPAEFFQREGKSNSVVKVTLQPGTEVRPKWPFEELVKPDPAADAARAITRPENRRFAEVLVNRVWKRYFGEGFVEPVHDWEGNEPSHPELLDYLAREFVASGYDLRQLSRIILNTEAFQREARLSRSSSPQDRFFDAPLRRRFSAEQVVDSLLAASGIPNYSEELTFDVESLFPEANFLNLGFPDRAWQMVSTASDRDRPSLTLTNADSILAVMSAYGWRDERPEPVVERETDANVLQPGMLANGLFGIWATRLSDHSELTRVAVAAESPEELVDELYLRYLTRLPTDEEKAGFVDLLRPGFAERHTADPETFRLRPYVPTVREISWTNHLSVKANEIATDLEQRAFAGPPPTRQLSSEWRERMEDAVWALVNSPELTFVP